jgi:hypothetical protein
MKAAMNKPNPDKAEVAIEYPDKLYIGTFERSSRFDAHFDEHGISLTLERKGDPATQNPFICTCTTDFLERSRMNLLERPSVCRSMTPIASCFRVPPMRLTLLSRKRRMSDEDQAECIGSTASTTS